MFVYFIQSGNSKKPPVKVGVAENIEKRLKGLQTGNPEQLKVLCSIKCANYKEAYSLESYIHSELSKRKIRGEWFSTCMRRVNKIVSKWYTHKEIELNKYREEDIEKSLDTQSIIDSEDCI